VPPERYPHTSKEVMASVVVPSSYEASTEPGGGARYHDPTAAGTVELSIRRFLSGLAHTPSCQVAAELHLHSGDGSRRWTSSESPAELDGATAQARTFGDEQAATEGTVITAQLGDTLLSVRAIWPQGSHDQRSQLLSMIDSIRLLSLEDLTIPRRSQLHPVFSISVARPANWRITQMDEECWEFAFPGGSCSLRELNTGHDLSTATVETANVETANVEVASQMLEGLTPDGAVRGAIATRPSVTRSPMFACEWRLGAAIGVAAVLLREIPILISMTSSEPTHLDTLREFIDSVRTHPALY
jgi:hypothetical protein